MPSSAYPQASVRSRTARNEAVKQRVGDILPWPSCSSQSSTATSGEGGRRFPPSDRPRWSHQAARAGNQDQPSRVREPPRRQYRAGPMQGTARRTRFCPRTLIRTSTGSFQQVGRAQTPALPWSPGGGFLAERVGCSPPAARASFPSGFRRSQVDAPVGPSLRRARRAGWFRARPPPRANGPIVRHEVALTRQLHLDDVGAELAKQTGTEAVRKITFRHQMTRIPANGPPERFAWS